MKPTLSALPFCTEIMHIKIRRGSIFDWTASKISHSTCVGGCVVCVILGSFGDGLCFKAVMLYCPHTLILERCDLRFLEKRLRRRRENYNHSVFLLLYFIFVYIPLQALKYYQG